MKTKLITWILIFFLGFLINQSIFAQVETVNYKVQSGASKSITIENGQLYRITVKSCWYSAQAYIGTYLVSGLNISDPKTNGKPEVLVVAETPEIDWRFSYSLRGEFDANMRITSQGKGDQDLLIVVEKLSFY